MQPDNPLDQAPVVRAGSYDEKAANEQSGINLRKAAEARLASSPPPGVSAQSAAELLHELHVHRIELEMQNEELRRAQVALESSRDRYVNLYEHAPVAYLTLSREGLITEINLTGAALLGVTATARNTLLKQPISGLIFKEDQDIFYLHHKKILETGLPQACDLRMVKHDGTQFWVNLATTATQQADDVTALHVVLNDISERKRREMTLQNKKDLYQRLSEDMPLFIVTFLPDGTLTYVNNTLATLVGMTPAQVTGMNFFDFLSADERKRVSARLASLTPEQPLETHEQRHLQPGAPDARHQWTNRAFFDTEGRVTFFQAFGEDITERIRSENSLKDSERRLSEILESVDAHIYLKDTQGRFLFANRPVRELFGASLEEIVGQSDENFFDAATFERIRANDLRVLEEGEISKKEETTVNLKDGSASTYLSVKIPLRNEAGKIYALCGISTDITMRKQAEEQLLGSMRKLEEKELAKTRFLAAAGHDLRQPVAAANLFVDALKLTAPTPRQSELIARLDQSMGVFSGLLERLLDISKFDAGLIKPQIASFNLTELFNWLEQNFAQSARERQLHFRFFFPLHRSLILRTDMFLLQSVLMNLVSNAIKFTTRGGILISARQRGDRVLLQVWDTGIGIAELDLAHIFDEFYQVANPQRNREAGLGLGLSICQRAMALLGSEVSCRSRPGHGSVFAVNLPLNGDAHALEELPVIDTPASVANKTLIQGKRVVVLEDDALVAAGMVNLLQGLGAEVRLFYNAEEALRHPDIANADCFIVDYALGGELTGLNFLVAVQQRQQTPLCAVVVTGETSSQFISGVADSPWPVLHKPINYAKLLSGLRLN